MIHTPVRSSIANRRLPLATAGLRLAIAGVLSLAISSQSSILSASDCGCETCEMPFASMDDCSCGCDVSAACPPKHNPLYRTLDAFAGGIEKLFGLDKCPPAKGFCDESLCDGACDSAPIDIGMMSIPEPMMLDTPGPLYYEPIPNSRAMPPAPVLTAPPAPMSSTPLYSAPRSSPRSSTPQTSMPRSPMHMTAPRIQTAPVIPVQPEPTVQPKPRPEPNIRSQPRIPEPQPKSDSLFDALNDPFTDGVNNQRRQSVRPSAYTSSSRKQTISKVTSSRRSSTQR
ncbi:hypothetical protein CA13_51410 [Planctomycetes bacterium CA13]|uniref:Uncharacterized protein n=2 Tax=Novipirellula herctigrandis TaxID=2527986 RepID=A0A5C5Z8N6_9BACT|nr:hypothetical protein CA13_51410 [Planctomycetes bacterium CA13]